MDGGFGSKGVSDHNRLVASWSKAKADFVFASLPPAGASIETCCGRSGPFQSAFPREPRPPQRPGLGESQAAEANGAVAQEYRLRQFHALGEMRPANP